MSTKNILLEAYSDTKKITGVDPSKPGKGFINDIISNDNNFEVYSSALAEGLDSEGARVFKTIANGTRRVILENSMFGINPYETLAVPLLRVFYPKTIAKELVTVIPMDKPEIVRGFIRASFNKFGSATKLMAPSLTDISGGPAVGSGMPVVTTCTFGATTDLLAVAGLDSNTAHIEKSFVITQIVATDSTVVNVDIRPDVDGNFSKTVTVGSTDYVVSGAINYLTGKVSLSSAPSSGLTSAKVSATLSLEENTINPKAKFSIEKIRLVAKDREISTEWSIQAEQDLKALFNTNIQAELVSVIGNQIALDIDREIVNTLIYTAENMAGANHTDTFSKTPPATFTWGPKQWIENVLPKMNTLSAQIYADTNISDANVIAANPLDATVFESLQEYRYNGSGASDGELGYESATIAGKKWKVFTSTVVPKGKVLIGYKPVEEMKACYIFSPYSPCTLSPWPMGNKPSLTILSRYGSQIIRPQGYSVLNITE